MSVNRPIALFLRYICSAFCGIYTAHSFVFVWQKKYYSFAKSNHEASPSGQFPRKTGEMSEMPSALNDKRGAPRVSGAVNGVKVAVD